MGDMARQGIFSRRQIWEEMRRNPVERIVSEPKNCYGAENTFAVETSSSEPHIEYFLSYCALQIIGEAARQGVISQRHTLEQLRWRRDGLAAKAREARTLSDVANRYAARLNTHRQRTRQQILTSQTASIVGCLSSKQAAALHGRKQSKHSTPRLLCVSLCAQGSYPHVKPARVAGEGVCARTLPVLGTHCISF